MLLPWSYSLVIKDHVRTEWPVYAEDHEPLMPEEFLTTTLPGPTSSMRGTANDDEWLAILTETSDINDMEEGASNIKAFLEALYSDVQPNKNSRNCVPKNTTLTTEHSTNNGPAENMGLLLSAPSTVRELVSVFLNQQKHILTIYIRPAGDRVREEIEKRNRRIGGLVPAKEEREKRRPSLERWKTMYGDGKTSMSS